LEVLLVSSWGIYTEEWLPRSHLSMKEYSLQFTGESKERERERCLLVYKFISMLLYYSGFDLKNLFLPPANTHFGESKTLICIYLVIEFRINFYLFHQVKQRERHALAFNLVCCWWCAFWNESITHERYFLVFICVVGIYSWLHNTVELTQREFIRREVQIYFCNESW